MTIKYRGPIFETNSSSTHSIAWAKPETNPAKLDSLYVEDGVCRIYSGEFGWEQDRFWDAATKASYCLTWIKSFQGYGLERLGLGTQEQLEQMLKDVIRERTEVEVEFVSEKPFSGSFYEWGYIDHQSIGVYEDHKGKIRGGGPGAEAFASKEALANFIFNRNCVLHTGNDNGPW